MHRIPLLLVAGLGLSACAFLDNDEGVVRTYPPARDFELISIADFNRTAPMPGSYNIRGFVIVTNECPPEALCIIADGISVYEHSDLEPDPDDFIENGIHLAADRPSQFALGKRYELSLKVEHERVDGAAWPSAIIVGYSRIR